MHACRRRVSLLLLAMIAFVGPFATRIAAAQEMEVGVAWPDTPAGRRARAYFEAYDADTDEAMRRFVLHSRSDAALKEKALAKRVAENRKIRKQIGRLEIEEVRSHNDLALDVIAQSISHGMWLRFAVQVEPDPPHYWIDMVGRPTKAPNRTVKVYDQWGSLSDLAERMRADLGAPGLAVAIAGPRSHHHNHYIGKVAQRHIVVVIGRDSDPTLRDAGFHG